MHKEPHMRSSLLVGLTFVLTVPLVFGPRSISESTFKAVFGGDSCTHDLEECVCPNRDNFTTGCDEIGANRPYWPWYGLLTTIPINLPNCNTIVDPAPGGIYFCGYRKRAHADNSCDWNWAWVPGA